MGLFFLPKKEGRSQGFRKRSWYLWGGRRQNQLQLLCPRWFLQQPSQTCGTGFVWKLMVFKLRVDFFNILLSSSKPFKADIAIASLAHVASSSIWNIPEKDEKWFFEWSIVLEWSKITATVHFGNLWYFWLYWPDVERVEWHEPVGRIAGKGVTAVALVCSHLIAMCKFLLFPLFQVQK